MRQIKMRQSNLKQTVAEFFDTIRKIKITELISFAPEYLVELLFHHFDNFDQKYGVETNSASTPQSAETKSKFNDSEFYWPTRESIFDGMMKTLNIDFSGFSFIDVGSGKGRVLILASRYPFQEVTGIEMSESLTAISRQNLQKYQARFGKQIKLQVEQLDALSYQFPEKKLFIYLFDPFGRETMSKFVDNLCSTFNKSRRDIVVLYFLPHHKEVFIDAGFKIIAEKKRTWDFSYPWIAFEKKESF